ncbi:hypothetical protein BJX70DRAFT_363533 [Aspergillus crustosus]
MDSISNPRIARPTKRVSNACVPCRSRHMKCDSRAPVCSRCQEEGSKCVYIKSRRGGHHRRKNTDFETQTQTQTRIDNGNELAQYQPLPALYPIHHPGYDNRHNSSPDSERPPDLIELYYSFFHQAHPCVLPQWSLRLRAAISPTTLDTLLPVLEYIGSLYSNTTPSPPLERKVLQSLAHLRLSTRTPSPFDIQAIILYSIAVYWCDDIHRSLELLDEAIAGAVALGMHEDGFDARFGDGDVVLEESWRRTWWVIYLTAMHMAGSTHSFPSRVEGVVISVGLPCEEEGYEAGDIPLSPPSLEDYETREFQCPTIEFSSFAELIGISRGIDLVLGEGFPTRPDCVNRLCGNADTSILAWLLLLPPGKQSLVKANGTVDQLLFRAHMLIYTYIVDLNRQFSTLHHTSLESLSRRTPRPPPSSSSHPIHRSQFPSSSSSSSSTSSTNINTNTTNNTPSQSHPHSPPSIHTTKVLTAIEKMNALLTLPIHLSLHTPFIICMIANTAIAHLSAYKWVYGHREKQVERGRIRLVMAVLKGLSVHWPLGRRTYREVVAVARDVLAEHAGRNSAGDADVDDDVDTGAGAGTGAETRVLGEDCKGQREDDKMMRVDDGFTAAGGGIDVGLQMELGYPGSEFESAMRLLSAGMGVGGFDAFPNGCLNPGFDI